MAGEPHNQACASAGADTECDCDCAGAQHAVLTTGGRPAASRVTERAQRAAKAQGRTVRTRDPSGGEVVAAGRPRVPASVRRAVAEARRGIPRTSEDWDRIVPRNESLNDLRRSRLAEYRKNREAAQRDLDAFVASTDASLRESGMRTAAARRRWIEQRPEFQRMSSNVEFYDDRIRVTEQELAASLPEDEESRVRLPRDPGTFLPMPTDAHRQHLATVISAGRNVLNAAQQEFERDPELRTLRRQEADPRPEMVLRARQQIARREAAILHGMVAELRPMGGVQHTNVTTLPGDGTPDNRGARDDAVERLRRAEQFYPDDWLTRSASQSLALTSADRAYYSSARGTLAMSTTVDDRAYYNGAYRDYTEEINVHELGHRMESVVPGLQEMEWTFVRSRSEASNGGQLEQLQRMRDITGNSAYGDRERSFRDDWADAYAGVTYEDRGHNADNPGRSPWEVFQVGTQDTFGRSTRRFDRGSELQAFTIGALLLLG